MNERFTIGQLAKAGGVPTSTIRYYEQRDLLHPVKRSPHGYRHYDGRSLQRLRFIRAAQDSGFVIKDIARLLKLRQGGGKGCAGVQMWGVSSNAASNRCVKNSRNCGTWSGCRTCSSSEACRVLDELNPVDSDSENTSPSRSPRGESRSR